jgi:hypothetical protein
VVGSILRSRLWVLCRPRSVQNAMRGSENPFMTANDWINSDQGFSDHDHAGEVRPDRTTRQYRSTGAVAICPVGSQIPTVLSIPTGTGCPEGHAASHDSTARGFGRHMSATVSGDHPSHRYSLDHSRPQPPESGRDHACSILRTERDR